ncbi:MAG: hypothetical protein A2W97_01695 [Bacteroidetes bacterium GWE2_40_63]|jgi:hypothetical protein|nr:MAG: hypothetical protein A2W95_16665 [Bacteroidetes bacterium GWA2_40_14]OFX62439.1 MAG: hypothetical protein A2W84_12615 [Bacteroidetes bacterium GWC2_40_13]OFX72273.1 MAG: hypothetical protein A2W96_17705 [Bacteroidetes bacterium GWD2_40_43]OFX90479.1 MAG: hypothetical protein A2W97_01695 [Bacteroidetes bacterium GWE2_40_63]OFY17275.1 MAG: hypothetical protein A2W88_15170 [Bacteroidetes bacterium GWF2_40_13]OFZ29107.1 MAG: hypothetical protein A2437_16135 [Bacteroidetes bacterium RIFOXYC
MFSNKKTLFNSVAVFWVLSLMVLPQATQAQDQPTDSVDRIVVHALLNANADELSATFYEKIDLVLPKQKGMFSKSQSKFILMSFFREHKPESYVELSRNFSNGSKFVVGQLISGPHTYRICYLVKREEEQQVIYQFSIEE